MDSRTFLEAARAVLADSQWIARGRISTDALFTAIEARLGVEKLPRRTWARHLSSLGLKSVKWSHGVRGWRLFDATPVDATPVDATPVDATPVDATPVDATPVDATPVDATEFEPSAGRPKCRVRLPNPRAAGYMTKEALFEAIKRTPDYRPCPQRNWRWVAWKYCEKCDWKINENNRRLS